MLKWIFSIIWSTVRHLQVVIYLLFYFICISFAYSWSLFVRGADCWTTKARNRSCRRLSDCVFSTRRTTPSTSTSRDAASLSRAVRRRAMATAVTREGRRRGHAPTPGSAEHVPVSGRTRLVVGTATGEWYRPIPPRKTSRQCKFTVYKTADELLNLWLSTYMYTVNCI